MTCIRNARELLCFMILSLLYLTKAQDSSEEASCDASSPKVLSNNILSPIEPSLFHTSNILSNVSIATIPGGEPISLQYIQNFLSPSEISKIISFCDNRNGWTASRQSNGQSTQIQKSRTSYSCPLLWPLLYLPKLNTLKASGKLTSNLEEEIRIVWILMQRIAKLLDVDEAYIEPLQLIRYTPGQFYKQHHDHGSYYGKNSEQRPMTFLLFLSDVPPEDGGGHTKFDQLDLAILPRAGDGILWINEDTNTKKPIKEALHQAVPPRENGKVIKYAMNVWIAREAIMENLDTVSYRTKLSDTS